MGTVTEFFKLNNFSLYDDKCHANHTKGPQEQDQNYELRYGVEIVEQPTVEIEFNWFSLRRKIESKWECKIKCSLVNHLTLSVRNAF